MPVMRKNRFGHMTEFAAGATYDQLYFNPDKKSERPKIVTNPRAVSEAFHTYMDYSDGDTKSKLQSLDEASRSSVLTNLTSKLYDHIVKKTTDIDYGDIPKTKGDITKMACYNDMIDICQIIVGILKEYHEKPGPIDVITLAITNLESRKDLFNRAYRADCEMPCMIYENAALAVVDAVAFMIACCIEFIKSTSDETFTMQIDKVAYAKSRDHILYRALEKFNKSCESGDLDKACNEIINHRVRKFIGGVAGVAAIAVASMIVILNIIPMLRELVYVVFAVRTNIADFFDLQAAMLTMNAYNVQNSKTLDANERKEIARKQMTIAAAFKKIANAVQIDAKQTDVKATREIQSDQKKYKIDDLDKAEEEEDDAPDEDGVSSLF